MKTKFGSYCEKGVAEGCKYCVKGEKLVLFVGGRCSRSCWYCSLSKNRKNSNRMFANERPCENINSLIKEAKMSNAKGAGVTGGDPLVYFDKILKSCMALKKEFGKSFHIHIYLPLNLVDETKIKKLSRWVDEFRFHPSFLALENETLKEKEIQKIEMASPIVGKENCGIEIPSTPKRKKEILEFILKIKDSISFVNLNEFEISETNFNEMVKHYKINKDSYTIKGSIRMGKWILRKLRGTDIKVHLCTAKTKDLYQYRNRLKRYKILPYGNFTEEGNVVYFCVYYKGKLIDTEGKIKKISREYYVDKKRKRIILNMNDVEEIYEKTKLDIFRIVEPPTFEAEYLEKSKIGE